MPETINDNDAAEASEGEDELGYHGTDSSISLVSNYISPSSDNFCLLTSPQISITSSATNETSDSQASRPRADTHPRVATLPESIRCLFAERFVPIVIAKVGCSSTPWKRVKVAILQDYFEFVYPNHDLEIARGDTIESMV